MKVQLFAVVGMYKNKPMITMGPYEDLIEAVMEAMQMTQSVEDRFTYTPVPMGFRGVIMDAGIQRRGPGATTTPQLDGGYL